MQDIRYLRLSELSKQIQQAIGLAFHATGFWVVADITNHISKPGSKAHYFELVEKDPDAGNIIARLSCKAWGSGADSIVTFEQVTGQPFTNNIHALLHVSVQFHPVFGLQLNLNNIDPHYTMGVLEQQKQDTLRQLLSDNSSFIARYGEGYITRNNQLSLRPVIRSIALLSAETSAGAEDFRHTLLHNAFGYTFAIDDYFTPVQGAGNAELLLAKIIAIFQSGKDYDAVVLIRGGGAQTDFLLFDHYIIGRAVAKFPIPFITGIGHQKNETIADLMAHTRTKTPTQAAEFILAHNRSFEDTIMNLQQNILVRSQQLIARNTALLYRINIQLVHHTRDVLSIEKEQLSALRENMIQVSRANLHQFKNALVHTTATMFSRPLLLLHKRSFDLDKAMSGIKTAQDRYFRDYSGKLEYYHSLIRILSPENILKKGFAIIKRKDKIIGHPEEIEVDHTIEIVFSETTLTATVTQKTNHERENINL